VAGGLIGTGLRLSIDALIRHEDSEFPLSTLIINVVGAFALGLLVGRLWVRLRPWVRAGLGAGLLGSFTTYSALAVSLVALANASEWMLAAGYLALSLVLGLLAAFTGLRLGSPKPTVIDLEDE
jgi:fluoride exporter